MSLEVKYFNHKETVFQQRYIKTQQKLREWPSLFPLLIKLKFISPDLRTLLSILLIQRIKIVKLTSYVISNNVLLKSRQEDAQILTFINVLLMKSEFKEKLENFNFIIENEIFWCQEIFSWILILKMGIKMSLRIIAKILQLI